MEGNTYGLFGTLGFKKSKFNRRLGGWDYPLLHRQRMQLKEKKKKKSHNGLICSLPLHGSYVERIELSLTTKEEKVKIWEAELNMAVWRTRGTCHLFKIPKFDSEPERYVVRS